MDEIVGEVAVTDIWEGCGAKSDVGVASKKAGYLDMRDSAIPR